MSWLNIHRQYGIDLPRVVLMDINSVWVAYIDELNGKYKLYSLQSDMEDYNEPIEFLTLEEAQAVGWMIAKSRFPLLGDDRED